MALSSKLVTTNTAIAATVALAMLIGAFVAIVELAPKRDFGELVDDASVVEWSTGEVTRAPERGGFAAAAPVDPALCRFTADQVFHHFEERAGGDRVEYRTTAIGELGDLYIGLDCPGAIHEGDWHHTAEILGVGIVVQAVQVEAEGYALPHWTRGRSPAPHSLLVELATSTFDVLSPSAMCDEALRQGDVPNAFTRLVPACLDAFRD